MDTGPPRPVEMEATPKGTNLKFYVLTQNYMFSFLLDRFYYSGTELET